MRGTVKRFNRQRGWGFITDDEGKDHFIHHSNIQMDGFHTLYKGDIVDFELGLGTKDREQAVNVKPIFTKKIVAHELLKYDAKGNKAYMVVDANNVIQAGENGITR